MNCLQAEENFSAHYEDMLDYQMLQQFESHMTVCEACQHEYVQFQESIKVSQQLPQVEPSSTFLSSLQHRLSQEQHEALSFWQRLQHIFAIPKWAFGGVIILVLATVGTFLYHDDFFNRDTQSFDVTEQINPLRPLSPSDEIDRSLPRGIGGVDSSSTITTQPMQQHYILKQVSYTTALTAGGL